MDTNFTGKYLEEQLQKASFISVGGFLTKKNCYFCGICKINLILTIYLLHAKNNNFFLMEKKITANSGLTEVEGAIQLQKGNVIVHWNSGVRLWVLNDRFDRQCLLTALLQPQVVLSCSDMQILQEVPVEQEK